MKNKIIAWSHTQDNIRSIIMVGSQARSNYSADEWSDLDLQIFCNDFHRYLVDTEWVKTFGKVLLCLPFSEENHDSELLVIFEGGQKVDFHFFPISILQDMIETQNLESVYQRGYECLVDKDDKLKKLPPPSNMYLKKIPPSFAEFRHVIELFWYEALFNAKMIRRRELWTIKVGDINGLKRRLLQMVEWQAQAKHGWVYDTWYGGKNLHQWVEPEIWEKMNLIFSHFDVPDSWKGLFETIKIFEEIAIELSRKLGFDYPSETIKNIRGLIEDLYSQDVIK